MNSFDTLKEYYDKIKIKNSKFQELSHLNLSIHKNCWNIKNELAKILINFSLH